MIIKLTSKLEYYKMMPLVDAKKFKEKEILLPDGETLHIESCEIISTRDGFAEVKITGNCLCYKSVTHMTMAMIREAIKCREFTDIALPNTKILDIQLE